jgi:hypothetical protein
MVAPDRAYQIRWVDHIADYRVPMLEHWDPLMRDEDSVAEFRGLPGRSFCDDFVAQMLGVTRPRVAAARRQL